MNVLAFDTATAATAVAAARTGGEPLTRRHDPAPGERPGHATRLLGLVDEVLAAARLDWSELDRIAVGIGPGTFTGLRIGVATARALALSRAIPLAAISTLRALAEAAQPAAAPAGRPVVAVIDARRGELFAAAWRDGRELWPAAALAPAALAERIRSLDPPPLAVGDGSVESRHELERAGALVPEARSSLHRVTAASHCRLAPGRPVVERAALLPSYLRLPDAEIAHRQIQQP